MESWEGDLLPSSVWYFSHNYFKGIIKDATVILDGYIFSNDI